MDGWMDGWIGVGREGERVRERGRARDGKREAACKKKKRLKGKKAMEIIRGSKGERKG